MCAPVAFDGSAYANDETTQFLSSALVNNSSIPFPDNGLGAIVYVEPLEGFYVAAGAADARADARETGFRTAFHREDYFLAIFETGFVPEVPSPNGRLPGAYRVHDVARLKTLASALRPATTAPMALPEIINGTQIAREICSSLWLARVILCGQF